ncbi:MAG: NfeD family protein [Limisphaerales bacterium]
MDFLVYSVCFAFGLLFTIISAFAGHLFGGHDAHADLGTGGHAEAGFDHTGMPGMSVLSPTVIASFITAFGGFGILFTKIEATKSTWVSAPLALVCGLAVAGGVFFLFTAMFHHTQSSSEGHVAALIGQTATVITAIPRDGVGEIAYVQAGTRYTAPARVEHGAAVANGQTVTIARIVGSQFYVAPI